MRPLHGSDVFHLREEGFGRPAHTLKVAVLGPLDGVPPDPDALAAWAEEALVDRPPFRWRVSTHLVHLGRPHWTDATPGEGHVVRETLAGPDPEAAFVALLGRLAGDQLPRDRPLWRLWVIDGLGHGRVAMVLQMHHALADGAASVRIWEELFADGPPEPVVLPTGRPLGHLGAALRRHAAAIGDLPRFLSRLRAHGAAEKAQDPGVAATYFDAPPTPFNRPPSGPRACAFAVLPLAELKATGRRLGGTVNDVYAALCAGALRAHLLEHGALPTDSLTATMPAGLDRAGRRYGNAMTTWFVRLATDEEDPVTRFVAVRASLAAARELQELDPTLLHDLQERTRLYDLIWRGLARGERRKGRPTFNAVISNVRGPDRLDWQGHPVVDLRSIGPLAGTMGLNFTAWSYGEDFTVGLHAGAGGLPDLPRLAQLLEQELAGLSAASRSTEVPDDA